jgi:hypothetical protein
LTGPYVVVPIDQTALSLPSAHCDEAFGPVGTRQKPARGMEAMSAIAVDYDGVLLGVAGQMLFNRTPVVDKKKRQKRPLGEKETKYWLEVMNSSLAAFKKVSVRPWYQLDRGGDFKEALQWAADNEDAWVTIRARHDRVAEGAIEGKLWDVVSETAALGHFELQVPGRVARKARVARMEVRATPVYLRLRDNWTKTMGPVITFAVHAVEVSKVPRGEEPVEWMLLVNRSIDTLEQAREVIFNYAQRWKIEEVHRVWKTTCTVEKSNLRSPEVFSVWASVLFCVAVRIERLKRLARVSPTLPASTELSELEIQTLLLLKDRKGYTKGRQPTIAEAVLWLAELGGYTGKSSGGPPGSQTIGRGLNNIGLATEAVRALTISQM